MAVFSVIVPVYNAEKTIRRCVQSLQAEGVEVILIEDGSKDGSWAACEELAAEFANVRALRNDTNRGVSYTRNAGLEAARGEYILFCDSDDYVDRGYMKAFRQAVAEGAEFALCGYINHDEKANGRTDNFCPEAVGEQALRPILEKLHGQGLLQQLWNKLFRASVIREHGIRFDETISIGEDMRFVLDYLRLGRVETVCLIPEPLYHYMRDQAGSLMYRMGYESIEEPLKNLRALYTLMGLDARETERRIAEQRQKQKGLYAYLIMHNMGMPMAERRRLILALDLQQGRQLWRKNLAVFLKEKLARVLK